MGERKNKPANTIEGRENQMIALAVDLAEKQLREGTASSQVITHFLKLGSTKEKLEKERLIEENKLLRAKTESIEAGQDHGELYEELMKMFGIYSGKSNPKDEVDDDYEDL